MSGTSYLSPFLLNRAVQCNFLNDDLVYLGFSQYAQRVHLCAELIAASMTLEPLGEVGANFSLQLSSRTQFTKVNNKKVIPENQCEKHKKSSLVLHKQRLI